MTRHFIFLMYFLGLFYCCSLGAQIPSIDDLTIEEKVGQLLMVHFNGTTVNDDACRLIEEAHVGGFIYYNWANGLENPIQVLQLSRGLQAIASKQGGGIPLFIAVDQEGGLVRRLTKGFTSFPGNGAVGRTRRPEYAENSALATGKELKAVGINVNFAPVVDVNNNRDNPIIGIRSFGANVDDVVAFGEAALNGYRRASIISCLKHFPGHGDVSTDPHGDLPIVNKRVDELSQVELMPFHRLAKKSDMIMTAHVMLPKIDPRKCATCSPIILNQILRKGMRYQGVVISDSLVMQGVLDNNAGKIENVVVNSFLSGCDILLLGGKQLLASQNGYELSIDDVMAIHRHLVKSVKNGRISEDQLNRSVRRILELKARCLTEVGMKGNEALQLSCVGCAGHQALANEIAKDSVRIDRSSIDLPYDPCGKKILLISSDLVAEGLSQSSLWKSSSSQFLFVGLAPSVQEQERAVQLAVQADLVVVCTFNAWSSAEQISFVKTLENKVATLFVIALRDERDAECFHNAAVVCTTLSPVPCAISAIWEKITRTEEVKMKRQN